jgi:hypothetical protein
MAALGFQAPRASGLVQGGADAFPLVLFGKDAVQIAQIVIWNSVGYKLERLKPLECRRQGGVIAGRSCGGGLPLSR